MLFVVLGSVLVISGSFVMIEAEDIADRLIYKCGSDSQSSNVQETWTETKNFLYDCDPHMSKSIESCPGFDKQPFLRKGGGSYYDYLEVIEYDFACAGFCEFYAQPLFNKNSDGDLRCSSIIGRHVEIVAATVGLPTFVIGIALLTIGVCLMGYDHL